MVLAENRKAYYNYAFLEKFEAGISLLGQEVKSIKTGRANLTGSYVVIRNNEAFWIGGKIAPYQPKNAPRDYNPERQRKLLLKKSEIKYLIGKARQRGLTFMPLKLYTKHGRIKMEFGIVKGKKKFDKKELIRKREAEREIERALKIR